MLFSYSAFHVKKKINVTITNVTFQLTWALSFPRMAGGTRQNENQCFYTQNQPWLGSVPWITATLSVLTPKRSQGKLQTDKNCPEWCVMREVPGNFILLQPTKAMERAELGLWMWTQRTPKTVYRRNVFIEAKNKERNRHVTDPQKWCMNPCIFFHLSSW